MTQTPLAAHLRAQIIAAPEALLDDAEIMRALMAARDAQAGANVVDIRGRWMARLETRLDSLENTHRQVLAAAWDNVSGTRLVQRAVVALVAADGLAALLDVIGGALLHLLRIDSARLLVETGPDPLTDAAMAALTAHPQLVELGAVGAVAARLAARRADAGRVTLRRTGAEAARAHPHATAPIASEATLPLALPGRAALLVLGAADPEAFAPGQGTDLLSFLQEVAALRLAATLA